MEGLPKPFGRYVLLSKLAIGGMAEIYKAKTYGVDGFEKQLVIKRILTHYSADKEFVSMLIDEAKLTVLLSHANIVQVFDLGKVGEDYFISMEYINGTNLRELMSRLHSIEERFPEDVSVYIMSEVCKGLDYAHRKADSEGNPLHIVHRDISPQNILISFEGEVKIVDFGIAKAAMNVSHTSAGILKGKISYMSPEQALGKPIDHRTDIFSAGLVLYEMLTGEKLFTGDTQFEVLNQIRTKKITRDNLPDGVPAALKTVLAKALTFNPRERYQNAADFQLDLTKYLYSSYLDFSPRQMSSLLTRHFEKEIKRKDPSFNLSEKTKSVLIRQSKLEDIVVHGPPSRSITEMEIGPDTSASEFFEETHRTRSITPFLWLGGVVLIVLLGVFSFLLWRSPSRQDQVAPHKTQPSTPAATEENEESGLPELGQVALISNPPGAKIFINDEDTGQVTPSSIGRLSLGEEYRIRLVKENYRDFYKTVAITTQQPVSVEATLTMRSSGVIEVSSDPPGAAISIDGESAGIITPSRIEALDLGREYTIQLTIPGFNEWKQVLTLNDLNLVPLHATLTPAPSTPAITAPTPPVAPVTPPPVPAEPVPAELVPVSPPVQPPTTTVTPPTTTAPEPATPAPKKPPVVEEKKKKEPVKAKETPKPEPIKKTAEPPVTTPPVTPEPAAPEPAAPPKAVAGKSLGSIQISSRPPRAAIYMDGKSLGSVSPLTLTNVPRNHPHRIKLILEGYKTFETTVDLSEKDRGSVNVRLEKE